MMRNAPDAARRMIDVESSTYGDSDVEAVRNNSCPCCGTVGNFYEGPSGGMSTNYECGECRSKFNVTFGFNGPFRVDILELSEIAEEIRDEIDGDDIFEASVMLITVIVLVGLAAIGILIF